jgi:hypothetical protein
MRPNPNFELPAPQLQMFYFAQRQLLNLDHCTGLCCAHCGYIMISLQQVLPFICFGLTMQLLTALL